MSKECRKCGHTLDDEDKYCPACGTPVDVKQLLRSKNDAKILGVCGGLAEYFDLDSNLIRLIATLLIVATGIFPGLIIYFVTGMIIPREE